MAFELFKQVGVRTKEYISVTENKTFGLPRTFIDRRGITPSHKAVLFYDLEAKKIAVKYGLKVRLPKDNQGAVIIAGSFFDVNGIDAAKYSGKYDGFEVMPLKDLGLGFDRQGDAYVITLKVKEAKPVMQYEPSPEISISVPDEPLNLDDIPF
jgi:hypothetical protein